MKAPKLPAGVTQEFLDEIQSASTEDLKARIVSLQVMFQENEAFKESPAFVSAQEEFDYAKERYKMVAGPIKETATSLKNRTKVVIERLKEKGAV